VSISKINFNVSSHNVFSSGSPKISHDPFGFIGLAAPSLATNQWVHLAITFNFNINMVKYYHEGALIFTTYPGGNLDKFVNGDLFGLVNLFITLGF
jgi:hypothetical protein